VTLAAFPAVIPGTSPRDAPAYLGTHHKMCHTNRPRVLRVLIVAVFFVVGTVTPVRATDGALHANTTNGTALPECTCCQEAMKRRGYVDDTCFVSPGGDSFEKPAASASAILAAYPNSQSGVYWIKVQGGVGAKEVYCDMTNGGWMLVMRGLGAENIPYGDARWTASDEIDAHNLLTPEFGTFAKSAAFASYDSATRVLLVAGGFSGANADGKFRSFEFDFDSPANTPQNLMFTTSSAVSWNSSYQVWRSTFGQDRSSQPMFQRGGSSANQTVGLDRAVGGGCGKPLMFGFQAGGGDDVNSGLGTNAAYCGGNANRGFAGGNWMGNHGSVQIWMK
jgi:hypothetical protein